MFPRRMKRFMGFCTFFLLMIFKVFFESSPKDHHFINPRSFFNSSPGLIRNSAMSNITKRQLQFGDFNRPTRLKNTTQLIQGQKNHKKNSAFLKHLEALEQKKLEKRLEVQKIQFHIMNVLKDMKNNKSINPNEFYTKPKSTARPVSKNKKFIAFKVSHAIDDFESSFNATLIQEISTKIKQINDRQTIYNEQKFEDGKTYDLIILVQVHRRPDHLRYLIESLSATKYINSSLVIFSHDFYDHRINQIVQNISSFRVMQIFFPYSIQLHPKEFPGRDPRDCQWNYKPKKTDKENPKCLNEIWPDTYGHYREAAFTQMKHHWWWKFFRVFRDLRKTKYYSGQVLFLEEDHYVSPDIIHMIHQLRTIIDTRSNFKQIVYSLGNFKRTLSSYSSTVEGGEWDVNKYNMGFALDRGTYRVIKSCSKSFCFYDDYNFDWTLLDMIHSCAAKKIFLWKLKMSRVFHLGTCSGTHIKAKICNLMNGAIQIKKRIDSYRPQLFPKSLAVNAKSTLAIKKKRDRPNGGWSDLRDRNLCIAISLGKIFKFNP